MQPFLDFLFGIRWWQWLAGTAVVAGLYYLVVGVVLAHLKHKREERAAEADRQRREQEEARKREEQRHRDARRREYVRKNVPTGPVEPVDLPRAVVVVQNRPQRLPTDAEVVFGTRRNVTVPVMRRGVSREHAKIRPEARGYVLYDLLSETGTFVNDRRVEAKVLVDGDVIRIGPVRIPFKLGQVEEES